MSLINILKIKPSVIDEIAGIDDLVSQLCAILSPSRSNTYSEAAVKIAGLFGYLFYMLGDLSDAKKLSIIRWLCDNFVNSVEIKLANKQVAYIRSYSIIAYYFWIA